MLIYHPAFDVNHGMFRMLRLLELNPNKSLEWDKYRILDFYYLFPHLLGGVVLPAKLGARKRRFAARASPYNRVPSPKTFLMQLRGIHEIIALSLSSKAFIEPGDLAGDMLVRSATPLPDELVELFRSSNEDGELVEMLATEIAAIPLNGDKGLKAKTRLLEHRYAV